MDIPELVGGRSMEMEIVFHKLRWPIGLFAGITRANSSLTEGPHPYGYLIASVNWLVYRAIKPPTKL